MSLEINAIMRPASLPTADELQTLTDAFQRDPISFFVQLGNCLIALGRPGDAIEVGTRALHQTPSHLDGNLMMGVAHSQLHQWKEAQTQLLRVVKADRQNGRGFRLLGEVLLRRNDYERALPVLQHAQNLNPSDSEILGLVRLARGGQALGPPEPIPTALPPAGGAPFRPAPRMPAPAIQSAPMSLDDDAATLVAGENGAPSRPLIQAPAQLQASPPVQAAKMPPTAQPPVQRNQRPSAPPPLQRPNRPSAPPMAPVGPAIRPRVIPAEKPKDAAQKGLRASAEVGEQYLNELLVGGLLDVPNVRVSPASYDVSPGKRWGRSSGRMFITLFVILISAAAGSGIWYWYADKQKRADVEKHMATAKELVDAGDQKELRKASDEIELALARDSSDPYVLAVAAEVIGLSGLLYGDYPPADVQRAIFSVESDIDDPSDRGYRELVIARASLTLSEIYDLNEGGDLRLANTLAELKGWLDRSPDDHLARWLLGRAYLVAGNEGAATKAFSAAHANGKGGVMGTIDLANIHLSKGDTTNALKLYDGALARSQNHALAFVGRSMARSDLRGEPDAAIADINIGLARATGPKLLAWKALAMAGAQLALQDYEAFDSALGKCISEDGAIVGSPVFIARVALGRIDQGRVAAAANLRTQIRWFAPDPTLSSLVVTLDAELLLARGLPQDALDLIKDLQGVRVESIRGRALFDLMNTADALAAFEKALLIAPEDIELQVWTEASRMMSTKGESRRKADEALDSLGRRAQAKTARFVHGRALAFIGSKALAEDKLTQSVTDIAAASPNALAYRSYLELAQLAFGAGKVAEASDYLDKAVAINPGYLPINDLYGQVLVDTDANKALVYLEDVRSAEVVSVAAEVAYARALAKTGGSSEEASNALRRAHKRGVGKGSFLSKAIGEVNPALFEELGIAPPEAE